MENELSAGEESNPFWNNLLWVACRQGRLTRDDFRYLFSQHDVFFVFFGGDPPESYLHFLRKGLGLERARIRFEPTTLRFAAAFLDDPPILLTPSLCQDLLQGLRSAGVAEEHLAFFRDFSEDYEEGAPSPRAIRLQDEFWDFL